MLLKHQDDEEEQDHNGDMVQAVLAVRDMYDARGHFVHPSADMICAACDHPVRSMPVRRKMQ